MNCSKADKNFFGTILEILSKGHQDKDVRPKYEDGTEAKTLFITDTHEKYDVRNGELPTNTYRKLAVKSAINEIRVIYQLQSNKLEDFHRYNIFWWDEFDIGDGTIGRRYGHTVRKYDLMNKLLYGLEHNPYSRRHIIDLWQYEEFEKEKKGLNPCAFQTEYAVYEEDGVYYIDMALNQRSSDFLMANSINKIQYLALGMMICSHLRFHTGKNWQIGTFSHHVMNVHIYDRHIEACEEIKQRKPIQDEQVFSLPVDKDFYDITIDDFVIDIKTNGKLESPLELAI